MHFSPTYATKLDFTYRVFKMSFSDSQLDYVIEFSSGTGVLGLSEDLKYYKKQLLRGDLPTSVRRSYLSKRQELERTLSYHYAVLGVK